MWGILQYGEIDERTLTQDGLKFYHAITNFDRAGTLVSSRNAVTSNWVITLAKMINDALLHQPLDILLRVVFYLTRIGLLFWCLRLIKEWFAKSVVVSCGLFWLVSDFFMAGFSSTWLDKYLSFFIFLSILFWIKTKFEKSTRSLVIAGVFLGLSVLTKPAGIFLVPMLLFTHGIGELRQKEYWKNLALLFLTGFIVFVVLYPAMWVIPMETTLARIAGTGSSVTMQLGGDYSNTILFYPYHILTTNPIILLGMLFFLWRKVSQKSPRINIDRLLDSLTTAGMVYLLSIIAISMLFRDNITGTGAFFSDRYLTPLIPLFTIHVFQGLTDLGKNFVGQLIVVTLFLFELLRLPIIFYFIRSLIIAYF